MGNIIGEVFDEYVNKQVIGRQITLGLDQVNNDSANQWRFNNSAWVRMISSVDVSENKVLELGLDKNYAGAKLAQNFILYNGVSSVTENGDNSRFNPSTNNQEYFIDNKAFSIRNTYGFAGLNPDIRPMPGIESVKVGYINRGFLANVDIELTAYSREQLAIIDALFMHPGYTFLLEWGHTRYIDNNTGEIIHADPDNLMTEPFTSVLKSPNPSTQYSILESIRLERDKRSANYDAFYGVIKNFQYSYQPNGSYKITIKAVSQGDIIEDLKVNSVDPAKVRTQQQLQADEQSRKQKLDDLEKKYQEALKYQTNGIIDPESKAIQKLAEKEVPQAQEVTDFYNLKIPQKDKPDNATVQRLIDARLFAISQQKNVITARLNKIITDYPNLKQQLTGENILADNLTDRYAGKSKINKQLASWKQYLNTSDEELKYLYAIKFGDYDSNQENADGKLGKYVDKSLYYVSMGYLLNYIQDNLLIYNKNIPYFRIDTGTNNLMLHYPKQASANPKVCIIPVSDGPVSVNLENAQSIYALNRYGRLDKKGNREFKYTSGNKYPNPDFDENNLAPKENPNEILYGKLPNKFTNPKGNRQEFDTSFLIKDNAYIANLMNIGLCLDFVASVANDNIDLDGSLNFITFIKEILNGVKASLGYINKFEVIYDKETNYVKILDNNILKYGNRKDKKSSPSEFVVNGFDPVNVEGQSTPLLFGSFVENVNFTSMLDNKFASMVSIAAQSDSKIVGMSTTGLSRFNDGLTDRVIPKKQSKDEIENNGQGLTEDDLSTLLTNARNLFDQFYSGFRFSNDDIDILMSLNRDIANYYINQAVTKKEIPSPLVIPFNLSLQMMGLSGMKINERFDVSEKILPPMFDNNSYNFITKAVSHEIKGNKWTTTLESQIINKEDPKAPDIPVSNADYSTFISTQNTSSSPIKGCPAWTPNRTGGGGLLTPNQVILDSLKEAKFITEATFASFKSTASPSVKFAAIIATQEGYGKTTTTGYKNNNPGNITGKGTAGSVTKTVTRGNKPETYTYAKYSTKKDGWDALINKFVTGWVKEGKLLPYAGSTQYPDCFATDDNTKFKQLETPIQENISYNYKAKEIPTLRQYLYQFCPPSSAGTDSTVGYISNVAKSLKEYGLNISSIDEPMTNYIT